MGDTHNINNGMRAADGSGDTLGLQGKAPSRGMRYLVKNITNKIHVATRNTSYLVTYSYAYTLEQERAEKRRHHTHPWIYGSRVGAWRGPFSVRDRATADGCGGQSLGHKEGRVNTTTCMPGTYDKNIFIGDEKAVLIPTQVSRDILGG